MTGWVVTVPADRCRNWALAGQAEMHAPDLLALALVLLIVRGARLPHTVRRATTSRTETAA